MNEPKRFQSEDYLSVLDDTTSSQQCIISQSALDKMRQWAETGYPYEVCGLLIGIYDMQQWLVQDVKQVNNLNTERASDRFQLDPAGYQSIDKSLRGTQQEIIGVFHSHPDCPAKPSPTDLENAWEGFLYPIISVHQGKLHDIQAWTVSERMRFQHIHMNSST